jgi:cytochrome oxidase assembly protein ShyY1
VSRLPDAATARSALRLVREPLWARITLAVIGLSIAFVFLGRWQWHRHEARLAANALVAANYGAEPVPIEQVLPTPLSTLPGERLWTPVRVTGHYEPENQVLIRNRPLAKVYGYEVVVPLRTASGVAVLVDRGWLAAGEQFVRPDTVPAPPSGEVTVVVRLRFGEGTDSRQPPPGQELRIDTARIAAHAGGQVYLGGYGQLAQEQPAPAVVPTALPKPDDDLGPHLSYAVQWWAGAVAAYVMLGVYSVREVRDRAEGRPIGGSPGRRPVPTAVRSRRRGPTDEEWEDAADR